MWKLHEDSLKCDFMPCINKYRACSQKHASVKDYCGRFEGSFARIYRQELWMGKGPSLALNMVIE